MTHMRTFSVYTGRKNGRVMYVGTTIQEPAASFRWHKANGKPLQFSVVATFDNADAMLDEELRLIGLHKPPLNKIMKRRQNLNVRLSPEELQARRSNSEWCQGCLRRHVNPGHTRCMYCGD